MTPEITCQPEISLDSIVLKSGGSTQKKKKQPKNQQRQTKGELSLDPFKTNWLKNSV